MIKTLKLRFGQDTEFVVTGTYPEVCAQLYPDIRWRTVLGREADTTPYNHIRVLGRIARVLKHFRFYIASYLRRFNIPFYKVLLSKYDADTLNEYATSDYIISSGGTYLIEPYGIMPQYLDYRISLILGKPLIQYTQSMGPFYLKQTRARLRRIFNRCRTILVRDQQSANNVLSLNIANSSIIHIVPDAAFALGDIGAMMKRKDDSIKKYGNVAISVRDWIHASDKNTMSNYRKCIADVVVKLVDMGYCVHFISTCQGISSYTDDNIVVDNIMALIPKNYYSSIVKYEGYLSISKIIDLLKIMDFIIATRLHMSILALISGTPVYPIAYEFKTVELYHSLGYKNVESLDSLKSTSLPSSVTNFINWFTHDKRLEIYNQVASYINQAMNVANLIK